jgi:hypothetical protein
MPFTQFTNLDFDQIKTSIKDYLRANSTFTDFDFEGSNFSALIDTLAYNTYITAFNSNMVVNESFLDSATVRENVVSLARNIGYVPYSRNSANAVVSFSVNVDPDQILQNGTPIYTSSITLQAGLVCTGSVRGSSYVFSIPESVTVPVVNGVATFSNITIREGTFLTKKFTVDASLDQKFILDNPFIDTSTIRVYVKGISDSGLGSLYSLVDNIFDVDSNSEIFLVQEVQDEKYQLLFGDGIFGKKLENSSIITTNYIITSGKDGNGADTFSFAGSFKDADDRNVIATNTINVTTNQSAQNGSDIETIDSIRYFAPRLYSSQYRAVTASDYETIIKSKIYKNAESVSVVGGEELVPPEYGTVSISIKPKNGTFVSDFDKEQILSKLSQYSVSGVRPKIVDLKILYVEVESYIYYNSNQVGNVSDLKTRVTNSLNKYSQSVDLNKFGGRFKYSKLLQVIDNTDVAITSNITRVRIRRDLKALINRSAQYEICFGNQFHANSSGYNIKSTGFNIKDEPDIVYLTDTPNADGSTGVISIVKPIETSTTGVSTTSLSPFVVVESAGVVNYTNGEITLNTITITSTELENDLIEIQAYPESNDVIGLKDLYVSFDVSKSQINMVKDTIASGEDISGVVFAKNSYRSSYSNGKLMRSVI